MKFNVKSMLEKIILKYLEFSAKQKCFGENGKWKISKMENDIHNFIVNNLAKCF